MNEISKFEYVFLRGNKIIKTNSQTEATHILLSKEDYKEIRNRIENIEKSSEHQEPQDNFFINYLKKEELLNQRIEDLNVENNKLTNERDSLKRICNTFIRQAKERSNADRNLYPKKQHSGYCLVSSNKKTYRYKYGNNTRIIDAWETIIQTYYNLEYEYEDVYPRVLSDLTIIEDEQSLIKMLGFDSILFDEDLSYITKEDNNCFGYDLRVNGKEGYWEAVIHHINPISKQIPHCMRFKIKKKSNKKRC